MIDLSFCSTVFATFVMAELILLWIMIRLVRAWFPEKDDESCKFFGKIHDSPNTLLIGKFRFTLLQLRAGRALLMRSCKKPDDISSIILVTPRTAYFKSDAVLCIARGLDGKLLAFAGTLGPIVPKIFRNTVYDFVANNRYRFSEVDQCRLDFDNEFEGRFVPDDL